MGFRLDARGSLKQQQNSKVVKESSQLPQASSQLKYQGRLKLSNSIAIPYGDLSDELGQESDKIFVQTKHLQDFQGQRIKGKEAKHDELVKHMSNLPSYLQRVEKGESLKGKALNVGVLDWTRLEKWKHSQKFGPVGGSNNLSSTGMVLPSKSTTKLPSNSNTVPGDKLANKSKQHASNRSKPYSSQEQSLSRGTKPSTQKVIQSQEIENAPNRNISQADKSSGKKFSDVMLEKGKTKDSDRKVTLEMGNMPLSRRNHGIAVRSKETLYDDQSKKIVEQVHESNENVIALGQKIALDMEFCSSKPKNVMVSSGRRKVSSSGCDDYRKNKLQESEIDLSHRCPPEEHQNIVILRPTGSAQNCMLSKPQVMLDENQTDLSQSNCPDKSFQKASFEDKCSVVPRSCSLTSGVDSNSRADMMFEDLNLSIDASARLNNTGRMLRDDKNAKQKKIKPQNAEVDAIKILETEMTELATKRSRNQSPNRRFSFSLSRMSRSFSFKEGSAVPQLSSTYVSVKSGPVGGESSGYLDDLSREKANRHHRTRSSPLRRMLDPILKSKGSNSLHSAENDKALKGNLNSFGVGVNNANEPRQKGKDGASITQALLQLTVKNGLPLFRFAVDSSSNILAATMKSLASSGKDDAGQHYTFYSVNEIKKKSGGWITPGSREKSCGYVYNIIGQMKSLSSYIVNSTGHDFSSQDMVTESTLFGFEQRQGDQSSPKFSSNLELAATVIKTRGKSFSDVEWNESQPNDDFSFSVEENEGCHSINVILPGGLHSLPNKGVPSPLIERWKSGGSCDCGGWDVGCKLRILSNESKSKCCRISRTKHAELFVQGENQQQKPVFSLVPHKNGIYAVEFNSLLSALQAFFISVTVINCQKSTLLPEVNMLLGSKSSQEPRRCEKDGLDKKPTSFLGKMPAKYAPNPPLSPAGRV